MRRFPGHLRRYLGLITLKVIVSTCDWLPAASTIFSRAR